MKAPLRPGTRPVGAAQLAVKDTYYLLGCLYIFDFPSSTRGKVAPTRAE